MTDGLLDFKASNCTMGNKMVRPRRMETNGKENSKVCVDKGKSKQNTEWKVAPKASESSKSV